MTQSSSPRGPLPKRVYARRRLLVLIVALAIIAIIVAIVWPRGGDAAPGSAETPGSTTSTGGPVIGDGTPGATAGATTGPTAQDGDPCQPGRVSITANTDAEEYASGQPVQIWLTLQNNSAHDCVMDVSPEAQWFQITSPSNDGAEVYWTSTDCQSVSETTTPPVLLKAGVPVPTPPITWDRKRSVAGDCSDESVAARETVGGGGASFDLVVKVGDLESQARRFYLF
ncbi:MAG TPA: hypothetical protein VNQ48_09700 [Microbacteriaceae bacterium]|nr:hypothetical protein [Microbacteriaceae bacterium]